MGSSAEVRVPLLTLELETRPNAPTARRVKLIETNETVSLYDAHTSHRSHSANGASKGGGQPSTLGRQHSQARQTLFSLLIAVGEVDSLGSCFRLSFSFF